MNVSEMKLINFENMVISEAEQKRNAILEEIEEEKKVRFAQAQEELKQKAQQTLRRENAKISKVKNEHIFHQQLLCKQEILGERKKLIDEVFEGVIRRLNEFAASEDYEKYLLNTIISSKKDLENPTVVQISKKDEMYSEKIKSMGFTVEYTDEIIIGGFLMIDKENSVRIDEMLISKVKMAKDKFLETYNLKM